MTIPTHTARHRKKVLALAIAVPPFVVCRSALADRYWINSVTNDSWNTGADWDASSPSGSGGAGVPGANDNVYLNNSTSSNYTVTLNTSDSIGSLVIGNTGGGTEVLSQTAGTLGVQGDVSVGTLGSGGYSLSGGSLVVGGDVLVGDYGAGTFNESGTAFQYVYGSLDVASGSYGSFNLSGNSILSVSLDSQIGNSGTANFVMTQNSTFFGTNVEFVGDAGVATVSEGDNCTNSADLGVYLGYLGTGVGTYILSGSAHLLVTTYDNPFSLLSNEYVGVNGSGTFLQSGTTSNDFSNFEVGANGSLSIGEQATGKGYYSLSGGSIANASQEIVGNYGTGTFIQSGGSNAPGSLSLGSESSGSGYYSLSGSGSLSVSGDEYDGNYGSGTFNQSGGVQTIGGNLYVAANAGNGSYSLTGGSLTVNSNVYVGGSSSATGGVGLLNINGGSLSVAGTLKIWETAGTYVFLDSGSQLSAGTIDNSGDADDLVWTGGTLNITGSSGLIIGSGGLFPHLNFNSNTTLSVTQSLAVSGGTLTQNSSTSAVYSATEKLGLGSGSAGVHNESAGVVDTNTLLLGIGLGSYGTYNLSGTGSLTVNRSESVSDGGAGTFNQTGGLHTIGTPALPQQLEIAPVSGGAGTYLLGGGSVTVNGSAYVGGSSGGAGGAGNLAISAGSMSVSNTLQVYSTGTLILNGGSLTTNSLVLSSGGVFNAGGGTLIVSGGPLTLPTGGLTFGDGSTVSTLQAQNATVSGGPLTVAPASILAPSVNGVPGELTASSSVTLSSSGSKHSILSLDLGAPTAAGSTYDQINQSGGVFTTGGATLELTPTSGVETGTAYPIVITTNSASINYSSAFSNLTAIGGGVYLYSSGGVSADVSYSGSAIDVTFLTTPEPASLSLLAMGATAILGRRRRVSRS